MLKKHTIAVNYYVHTKVLIIKDTYYVLYM